MPHVSEAHLAARRRQILDAARACFVRNGFHATSMQDILKEAGLSSGALYLYFRGKHDIVAAIAAEALAAIASAFDAGLTTDPLPPIEEVVSRMLTTIEHLEATQSVVSIAIQVWGEAIRSPSLREHLTDAIHGVLQVVTRLVAVYQNDGVISRDVPADSVARVLVGLVQGFFVQHALIDDTDVAMFRDGLRAVVTSTILDSPLTADATDHR